MSENQTHNWGAAKRSYSLAIQRMREGDIEQVIVIEKESFSDAWSKKSFIDDLKNPLALPLVVKKESEVVGYASLWQVGKELEIGNLAVARKHRKTGIGKLLMKQVLEEAAKRECSLVLLDVRESNRPAISLYEKFGFSMLDKRKGYYRFPKEDALVMFKSLREE